MNILIIFSFLLTSTSIYAQSLSLESLKNLFTQNQTILEKVNPGMTKKVTTTGKIESDSGSCNYRLISTQTIIKMQNDKMIIFAKEKFSPQKSAECMKVGYTASTENSLLYFQDKPTLAKDLSDLDLSAKDIQSINKMGAVISLDLVTENELMTIQYDLTKPSFKNIVLSQTKTFKTLSEDLADLDIKSLDLKKVLFCDNNDGDNSECSEGDYSDILF